MPLTITEYDTNKLSFVAAHKKDNLYIVYYNFVHAHILSDPINIDNHRTTFRINQKYSSKKIYFKPTSQEAHNKYIENKNNLDNKPSDSKNGLDNINVTDYAKKELLNKLIADGSIDINTLDNAKKKLVDELSVNGSINLKTLLDLFNKLDDSAKCFIDTDFKNKMANSKNGLDNELTGSDDFFTYIAALGDLKKKLVDKLSVDGSLDFNMLTDSQKNNLINELYKSDFNLTDLQKCLINNMIASKNDSGNKPYYVPLKPLQSWDQTQQITQVNNSDTKPYDPINSEYINNYTKFINFMNNIKLILKDDFVKKHVTGKNPDATSSCDIVLTVKTNKLNNINGAISNGNTKYSISLDELKYILRSNIICRLEVCPEYFYIGKRKKDGRENFRLGVTLKSLHIENDQLSKLPKRVETMIKYCENKDKINDIKQLESLYNNKIIPQYMSKKSIVSNILNASKNM